jgi:hypothetical protein
MEGCLPNSEDSDYEAETESENESDEECDTQIDSEDDTSNNLKQNAVASNFDRADDFYWAEFSDKYTNAKYGRFTERRFSCFSIYYKWLRLIR